MKATNPELGFISANSWDINGAASAPWIRANRATSKAPGSRGAFFFAAGRPPRYAPRPPCVVRPREPWLRGAPKEPPPPQPPSLQLWGGATPARPRGGRDPVKMERQDAHLSFGPD